MGRSAPALVPFNSGITVGAYVAGMRLGRDLPASASRTRPALANILLKGAYRSGATR